MTGTLERGGSYKFQYPLRLQFAARKRSSPLDTRTLEGVGHPARFVDHHTGSKRIASGPRQNPCAPHATLRSPSRCKVSSGLMCVLESTISEANPGGGPSNLGREVYRVFETVLDSGPTKSNPTIVGHSWGSPRFPIFCPNHWPDQPDRHLRLPLGEEPKTGLLREKRCCVRSEQSKMTESTGEDGEPEMGGRKNTPRRSTSRTKTRERRHKPTITVSASNPPGFTLSCALRLALVLMLIRRCFPDPSLSRSSSFQHFRALLLHRHPVNF